MRGSYCNMLLEKSKSFLLLDRAKSNERMKI